jgi:hypothetical protein
VAGSASTIDCIGWVLPRRASTLSTASAISAPTSARAPRRRNLSRTVWYAYAGCQPTFAPAKHENAQWVLTIGNPYFDKEAVRVLRNTALSPDDALAAICQRNPSPSTDPVCVFATQKAHCQDLGERLLRCELTPQQVAGLAK